MRVSDASFGLKIQRHFSVIVCRKYSQSVRRSVCPLVCPSLRHSDRYSVRPLVSPDTRIIVVLFPFSADNSLMFLNHTLRFKTVMNRLQTNPASHSQPFQTRQTSLLWSVGMWISGERAWGWKKVSTCRI